MDAYEARDKIWRNVCLKCKHVDKGDNCTACRMCEYRFALKAITKLQEYEKIGLSPRNVSLILAERNQLLFEGAREELKRTELLSIKD